METSATESTAGKLRYFRCHFIRRCCRCFCCCYTIP
ncbi:hypothetical protein BVRB_1g000540 [Beta vulgaris subsp. vulgaris]|nr:hypothetical protein BVRB_1g000540 [Beta vulgaris subsp. vulgaris]